MNACDCDLNNLLYREKFIKVCMVSDTHGTVWNGCSWYGWLHILQIQTPGKFTIYEYFWHVQLFHELKLHTGKWPMCIEKMCDFIMIFAGFCSLTWTQRSWLSCPSICRSTTKTMRLSHFGKVQCKKRYLSFMNNSWKLYFGFQLADRYVLGCK